jgi:hypothetical protein
MIIPCDAERVNAAFDLADLIEMSFDVGVPAVHYLLRPYGPNTHNGLRFRLGRATVPYARFGTERRSTDSAARSFAALVVDLVEINWTDVRGHSLTANARI